MKKFLKLLLFNIVMIFILTIVAGLTLLIPGIVFAVSKSEILSVVVLILEFALLLTFSEIKGKMNWADQLNKLEDKIKGNN